MRSTDPAGTKAMNALLDATRDAGAETPLVAAYDPGGVLYGGRFVVVDTANGTGTADAAMVQTTLALAKAVPAASKPNSVIVACQAAYLQDRTLPTANTVTGGTRALDGLVVVIPEGVHSSTLGGGVTNGATMTQFPPRIIGDPDNADPRANCILQSPTANPSGARFVHVRYENLTVEIGQFAVMSGMRLSVVDNCTVRGKAGFETASNTSSTLTSVSVIAEQVQVHTANSRWFRTQGQLNSGRHAPGLVRNCEHSRTVNGLCMVGNRFLRAELDPSLSPTAAQTPYSSAISSDLKSRSDVILAFNIAYGMRGPFGMTLSPAPAAAWAGTKDLLRNFAVFNNLMEGIFTNYPFMRLAESAEWRMENCVIEGNTMAGNRLNGPYNDPLSTTDDGVFSELHDFRVANNAVDWMPSKQDSYNSPPYRPWLTQVWAAHNGVNFEGNVDSYRGSSTDSFSRDFNGLRAISGTNSASLDPLYTDDATRFGSDLGDGDYTPGAGSPLLGLVFNGQSDVDVLGNARSIGGAAGAIQPAGNAPEVALAPEDARHDQLGGSPGLGDVVSLAPASAFHGYGGFDPMVAVLMGLAPAQGWLMVSAADANVGVRLGLAPARSGPVMLATQAALSFGDLTIAAEDGRIVISGAGAALGAVPGAVPGPAGTVGLRVLRVGGEQRVFFARLG